MKIKLSMLLLVLLLSACAAPVVNQDPAAQFARPERIHIQSSDLFVEDQMLIDPIPEPLAKFATRMRDEGHWVAIVVDYGQSEQDAQNRSQRRALAIMDYLLRVGIDPDRLGHVGMGEGTAEKSNLIELRLFPQE